MWLEGSGARDPRTSSARFGTRETGPHTLVGFGRIIFSMRKKRSEIGGIFQMPAVPAGGSELGAAVDVDRVSCDPAGFVRGQVQRRQHPNLVVEKTRKRGGERAGNSGSKFLSKS